LQRAKTDICNMFLKYLNLSNQDDVKNKYIKFSIPQGLFSQVDLVRVQYCFKRQPVRVQYRFKRKPA